MYAGMQKAKGDYVAILDADMQDPPSLIPDMINALDSGEYDIVAARRVTRKGEVRANPRSEAFSPVVFINSSTVCAMLR